MNEDSSTLSTQFSQETTHAHARFFLKSNIDRKMHDSCLYDTKRTKKKQYRSQFTSKSTIQICGKRKRPSHYDAATRFLCRLCRSLLVPI